MRLIEKSIGEMWQTLRSAGYLASKIDNQMNFQPGDIVNLRLNVERGPQFLMGSYRLKGLSAELDRPQSKERRQPDDRVQSLAFSGRAR
ncbi:hypothetical protein [Bryobacter aggregatus]|uniref:hypothetical protein n=1 Tax=Bryobacter aggregatus TaxID=360054 RepID=UPI0004E207E2|nr:hypothetical protein [Bryobacter aggregatus]